VRCGAAWSVWAQMMELGEAMAALGASCVVPLAIDASTLADADGVDQAAVGGGGGGGDGSPVPGSVQSVVAAAPLRTDAPTLREIRAFPHASFDRVLLDGPCSALGQRPRLSLLFDGPALEAIPRLQVPAPLGPAMFAATVSLLGSCNRRRVSICVLPFLWLRHH
jgi:hypothetical protein